jgi:hypothetical protein
MMEYHAFYRAQWRALSCTTDASTTGGCTRIAAFTSASQVYAMIEAGHDGALCELELTVADYELIASEAQRTHPSLAGSSAGTGAVRADCRADGSGQ